MDINRGTFVSVTLFGTERKLSVKRITKVIQVDSISRYLNEEQYGVLLYDDESIILFDLRDMKSKEDQDTATAIITEVERNTSTVPIGFVVDYLEEYVEKFKTEEVSHVVE